MPDIPTGVENCPIGSMRLMDNLRQNVLRVKTRLGISAFFSSRFRIHLCCKIETHTETFSKLSLLYVFHEINELFWLIGTSLYFIHKLLFLAFHDIAPGSFPMSQLLSHGK